MKGNTFTCYNGGDPGQIFKQPILKDFYLYLVHIKFPSHKVAIRGSKTLADGYLLLNSLLFRLNTTPVKESAVLATPESCKDRIVTLYHSSIFAGHQGVIKTYLTINKMLFIQYITQ